MRHWGFSFSTCALLLAAQPAFSCECGRAGPACAYVNRAAIVFIGTVAFTDHDPALGIRQRTLVKFDVEEAFKGLTRQQREVWVDPGSFTSCYAEYHVGKRLLVFAYGGLTMPSDTALMSVVGGQNMKPLPQELDPKNLPVVYSAPECSGTRSPADAAVWNSDLAWLRQFKAGKATRSVRGRITEDQSFGIFGYDVPGLPGVTVDLVGNGIRLSAKSDADGFYAIDNVPTGAYGVTASLPPYVPKQNRTAEVEATGCSAADFDMVAHGEIRGVLLDSTGRPAPHVRIEILRLGRDGNPAYYAEKKTTTDDDGHYQFRDLPSGDFKVGVNVFESPDPKTPYRPTFWSSPGVSSIRMRPSERKDVSAFQLPPASPVRKLEARVHWPDGRPAAGVDVWGDLGDRAAAHAQTDADGIAHIDLLEGIPYSLEAKIWVGTNPNREVARSGVTSLTPAAEPTRMEFILSKRTKGYR